MVTVNTDAQLSGEYVTYQEAAVILGVSAVAMNRACAMGVFKTVRVSHSRRNLIPRWEAEALVGKSVMSLKSKELLEELRRQRSGEVHYNEDGTPNWMGKSDLERVIAENNAVMEEVRQTMHEIGDLLLGLAGDFSDEKLEDKVKRIWKKVVSDA